MSVLRDGDCSGVCPKVNNEAISFLEGKMARIWKCFVLILPDGNPHPSPSPPELADDPNI